MSTRGTALSRAVEFFRTGNYDEARVAFALVKEVMDARAAAVKSQAKATDRGGVRRTYTRKKGQEGAADTTAIADKAAAAS